jgi:hypothetical protein
MMQHRDWTKRFKKQAKKEKQRLKGMCKIMAMAGIPLDKTAEAWDFVMEAANQMTFQPERDGVGYAATTTEGLIYGERWVDPASAFKERYEPTGEEADIIKKFGPALVRKVEYNKFGKLDFDNTSAIMLHTRYATCEKALYNTHPFVHGDTALIHNGVIGNAHRELKDLMRSSTCDSEVILSAYLDNDVDTNPKKIDDVSAMLQGSYAVAVMGNDGETPYLDIFKNESTNLCVAKIKELETLVFCTNMEIIQKTCSRVKMTVEYSFYVRPGQLLRLNALTGELMSRTPFESKYRPNHDSGSGGNASASAVSALHGPNAATRSEGSGVICLLNETTGKVEEKNLDEISDEEWAELYGRWGAGGHASRT